MFWIDSGGILAAGFLSDIDPASIEKEPPFPFSKAIAEKSAFRTAFCKGAASKIFPASPCLPAETSIRQPLSITSFPKSVFNAITPPGANALPAALISEPAFMKMPSSGPEPLAIKFNSPEFIFRLPAYSMESAAILTFPPTSGSLSKEPPLLMTATLP